MSELGRTAYEAFSRQMATTGLMGTARPVFWPELDDTVRACWDAAADAVAQAQIEVDLNSGTAPGGF